MITILRPNPNSQSAQSRSYQLNAIGTMTINGTTITNISAASGGGVDNKRESVMIIIDNPDLDGQFVSKGHNLVGKINGGTGLVNGVAGDIVGTNAHPVDPKLLTPTNYGGPT